MKATPPNRGTKQKQTTPTGIPSGMKTSKPAAFKGDPRAAKGGVVMDAAKGGSFANSKRAPGLYDVTKSGIGIRGSGTGTGKGKQANFKKS